MARRTFRERVIRNYYENRDEIMVQNLSEIVSELWLADDEFKKRRLWLRAEKALQNLSVEPAEIARIVKARDEKALAKFLNRKF